MHFELGKYYHIYTRTNNEEALFKSEENYVYFLERYRHFLENYLATLAYCLMPTHLHFLVRVRASIGIGHLVAEDASLPEAEGVRYLLSGQISKRLGLLFSSYTKAINKRHHRHGSLFQQRAKAKLVNDERYLLTLISYIHQNPVRAGHVRRPEEWPFSSYLDLIEERNGTLPERELLRQYFRTSLEFKEFSKIVVLDVGHFKKSVDI